MFDRIIVHNWISLSKDVRKHLVGVFNLVATGIAEIRDQEVISDGHSNADLEKITAAKMAEYVGSNESFPRLWELTLAKVKYELNPPIILDISKMETKEQEALVKGLNNQGIKLEPVMEKTPTEVLEVKFCDSCDSKGVRHKKVCPKFVSFKK